MALYEKAKAAMDDKDAQAYLDLLHDDFVSLAHNLCLWRLFECFVFSQIQVAMQNLQQLSHMERCFFKGRHQTSLTVYNMDLRC